MTTEANIINESKSLFAFIGIFAVAGAYMLILTATIA